MSTDRQGDDLGILLGLAYQSFVVQLRGELELAGVDGQGRADGYVFRVLDQEPVTVTVLAERLAMTKQGAGQIVADMERRDLVTRHPDPADGRARLIRLTADGERALRTARDFHRKFETRLRQVVGADAVAGLVAVLTHIADEEGAGENRIRAHYL